MRVKLGHLLAWCAPCLPIAALGLPLVVFLPPHYAGTLGMDLATVGLIFALVRLVDIPIDPLIGAFMDNSRSRIGQFRPWMLGGALLLMGGVYFLFMARPGVTALATFLTLFMLYLGWSGVYLAQTAWGSRLSGDYAERARIFGYWTAANVLAQLLVLAIPLLVRAAAPEAPPETGIHAMGWFILALIPLTVLAAVLIVPEGEAPATDHRLRWADVARVLGDGRMRRLLVVDLLLAILPGITGALFIFFFTAARDLPQGTANLLLFGYFVAGLVAAPLWIRLAKGIGKHRALALAAFWQGAAQLLVIAMPADNVPLGALAMVIAGIPFAAPSFLLRAMLADLNDAQALDRRRSGTAGSETVGLNYAILTATQKLGFAVPVGLTYPILSIIGFDAAPGAANSEAALDGLVALFVIPPLLLGIAASLLARRWPITADAHAGIRAALAHEAAPAGRDLIASDRPM
jgi:Na+/melibiose symporter-like transporter